MGSRCQVLEVACPACASINALTRWEVIDLSADPGLAERIATHHLNQTRCARCARWVPEPPGTLLLFVPHSKRHLVFSATFGHESTVEERGAGLQFLQEELGTRWDDAWLQGVFVIDRYLLPTLLEQGPEFVAELKPAIVALMKVEVPAGVPAVLDTAPFLSTPPAIAALEALAEVQSSEGLRAQRAQLAALLRDCRVSTVEDAMRDCDELCNRFQPLYEAVNRGDASGKTRALAAARGELLQSLLRRNDPQWLRLTTWLADLLVDTPEARERGISLYAEALAATPKEKTARRANLLQGLGLAFCDRDEGDRARNIEQAIGFLDASLAVDPDAQRRTLTLINRAAVFADRPNGDRAENIERAIRDLAATRELLDTAKEPERYALLMHNLGNLYRMRLAGEPILNAERALWAYQIAHDHWRPQDAVDRARTESALAGVHLNRQVEPRSQNLDVALGYARDSLRELSAERHPTEFLVTCVTLGLALAAARDELDAAIKVVAEALQETGDVVAPGNRAHALTQLAFLFKRQAAAGDLYDVERAAAAYHAALKLYPASAEPHARWKTLIQLADLYFDHQWWDDAAAIYSECESLEDALPIGFSRAAWRAHWSDAAAAGVRRAYALARRNALEESVLTFERIRARELRETLGHHHPDLARLQTQHPESYQRFLDAVEHLETLQAAERQRSMRAVQGMGMVAPEGFAGEYAEARACFDEALAAIVATTGFEGFLAAPEIEDIWKIVRPERPLVYLATTTAGTLALLLQRNGKDTTILPILDDALTSAHLQGLLVRWPNGGLRGEGHYELAEYDPENPDRAIIKWKGELPAGGYLHAQIRAPAHLADGVRAIRDAFAGLIERLVERLKGSDVACLQLVATGKLGLLPIHAALPGAMQAQGPLQPVSYVPSAVVLHVLRTIHREKASLPARLAGIANPLPQPVPLRFAGFELDCIAERFPPGAHRTLQNFNATRDAVLDLLADEGEEFPTYLHMACHGRFDILRALDSELLLAGGEGLKLVELLDRNLLHGTRLVTLSACQTAVPDINVVPDEVGSLAVGFLAAGATGVVATLWAVNDLACALLFARFYAELLAVDGTRLVEPAIALARAQSWLRTAPAAEFRDLFEARARAFESRHGKANPLLVQAAMHFGRRPEGEACYADPVDWAGFVYVGA